MSEDTKTYIFPEGRSSSSVDLASLMAMMNNGGLGGGSNWIWVLFLFALFGWGGNGLFGGKNGTSGLSEQISDSTSRELFMQAINGNRTAISELATNLNCSIGQIQSAIASVQSTIQSGNASLASQLSSFCCDNRLAICQQTNSLKESNNANTNSILAKLDQMENQAMQDKINALTEKNSTLATQLNLEHQNQTFAAMLAPIQSEVAAIKAAQPSTVAVPYPQLTAVPSYYMNGMSNVFTNGGWA